MILLDLNQVMISNLMMQLQKNNDEIEESIGENINFNKNPRMIYSNILSGASPNDLIIITGSNYIAKEIFS